MSTIGPMFQNLVTTCMYELKKRKNDIVNPILKEIATKCFPYLLIYTIVQIIIIILLIYIIRNMPKQ